MNMVLLSVDFIIQVGPFAVLPGVHHGWDNELEVDFFLVKNKKRISQSLKTAAFNIEGVQNS